jgi:membrane-bound lytic murein transglycosylase D
MFKRLLYSVLLLILALPAAAGAWVWGAKGLEGPITGIQAVHAQPATKPHQVEVPAVPAPVAQSVATPAQRFDPSRSAGRLVFEHNPPRRVPPFPLTLNRTVQRYIDSFLNQPQYLESSFNRVAPYMPEMVGELENRGLPKDLIYLAFAESEFSKAGAGPWQLSRATARRFGLHINRYVDERRDPVKSTRAAAQFLAGLHDEIGDWRITLASWNRGEASIDRFWALRGADYGRLMKKLPRCTRSLLNRFMAVAFIARNADTYGFDPIVYSQAPFQRVGVPGGTLLSEVARTWGTTVTMVRDLNPAILRDRVPPDVVSYEVWVPRIPDQADADPLSIEFLEN